MDTALEARALSILAISAATLLVVVTGGIVYLTLVEWRDRRRKSSADLERLPRRRRVQGKAKSGQGSSAKGKPDGKDKPAKGKAKAEKAKAAKAAKK